MDSPQPHPPRPHPAATCVRGDQPERVEHLALVAFSALFLPPVLVAASLARFAVDEVLGTSTPPELVWLALPVSVVVARRIGWSFALLQRREEQRQAARVADRVAHDRCPPPRRPGRITFGQAFVQAAIAATPLAVVSGVALFLLQVLVGLPERLAVIFAFAAGTGATVLLFHIDRFASILPRWRVARRWMQRDWDGAIGTPGR